MGRLGLTLITGPANAGKVALLLRRYLDALPREPLLIVPNRPDVDRVERELIELQPALLGGTIGTFDDLFERIARGGAAPRRIGSDAQRALLIRRAVSVARAGTYRGAATAVRGVRGARDCAPRTRSVHGRATSRTRDRRRRPFLRRRRIAWRARARRRGVARADPGWDGPRPDRRRLSVGRAVA